MSEINIILELIKYAPVIGVFGWWVWSLKTEKKEVITQHQKNIDRLQDKIDSISEDYKEMAEKSLKLIALADDKLSKSGAKNQRIDDIHRIVIEINETVKKYK